MKAISPETLLIASLAIALVPLLIGVGTCYLKFTIVLSLLRSGFGTQQAPSTSLVMALSLIMSLVVMQPVLTGTMERLAGVKIEQLAAQPLAGLMERGRDIITPWREFLLKHSGERELAIFKRLANGKLEGDEAQVDNQEPGLVTIVAAFTLSEIKKGFTIAFFLLIPFFVIDLIVANILVGMGLTMMSPVIVSLPLKLLLFVSSDGWLLLAQSLIRAYQ